ncbi:DsbA family protein [Hyphomonas sp. WL0036]|uniref:thioredoxin domain-containing protein n=1 Tax=Hyphomonas sediminis TaxID=2866160 RepID=UPI001C7E6D37|nr:thioredoxin domain-containing protein [Hyphomonas sediminis]MBY9067733.1 DsbA family protein [Hyphomonas sediminis]
MLTHSRRFAAVAFSALALVACGAAGGGTSEAEGGAGAETSADGELGHVKGNPDAPLTIIEYASPTCPACKYFHDSIQPAIEEKFVATGKVKFIFREYPLNEIDVAAYAMARCAPEGKFFDILDDLYENQEGVRYAAQTGVVKTTLAAIGQRHGIADRATFDACLENREIRQKLADVYATSEKWGVGGTPTFIIDGVKRDFGGEYTTADGFVKQIEAVLAAKGVE